LKLRKNINRTYPRACVDEVACGSYRAEDGEDERKNPYADDDGEERVISKLPLEPQMCPCLQGDDEDEEGRSDVAEVDQKALDPAGSGARNDVFEVKPVPTEHEAECLEEVGDEEVAEEDHEHVPLDVFGIELVPS
jgi:hypothetical protein